MNTFSTSLVSSGERLLMDHSIKLSNYLSNLSSLFESLLSLVVDSRGYLELDIVLLLYLHQ